MKIAQITWITYPNFGTFLQAFALQYTLSKYNVDCYIIDDRIYANNQSYIRSLASKIFFSLRHRNLYLFDQIKIERQYNNFKKKFIKIDNTWSTFSELNNKYSIFICGSDQIWSPILPNHYDGFYFASFASNSAKKIAYAPSLGSKTYREEFAELVRPWLDSFNALSAREETGAHILSEITGITDIPVVLDPTLLLTHSEWSEFERQNGNNPVKKKDAYLLAYFLTFNEKYLEKTREIANAKGLKLILINNILGLSKYSDEIINCGPLEFLSALAGCNYFITDSFHGSIFALQLHKPFLTLKRFKDESYNSQNSRIENLFRLCDIKDNFLDETSYSSLPIEPDWKRIEKLISIERQKSLNYLKMALTLK